MEAIRLSTEDAAKAEETREIAAEDAIVEDPAMQEAIRRSMEEEEEEKEAKSEEMKSPPLFSSASPSTAIPVKIDLPSKDAKKSAAVAVLIAGESVCDSKSHGTSHCSPPTTCPPGYSLPTAIPGEVDLPKDLRTTAEGTSNESFNEEHDLHDLSTDESYARDAAGCGEVAEGLGEALDMIGSAIDDMNLELDRTSTFDFEDNSDEEPEIVEAVCDEEPEIVVDAVCDLLSSEEAEEPGATIVEGADSAEADEESSHQSWHVVTGDQVAGDEALARAAQVIGSALFHSDMVRSHENVSTLSIESAAGRSSSSSSSSSSSDSHASSITSVPTTIPSLATEAHVSTFQRERWSQQLGQLHELGFLNDALSIDIIERLAAVSYICESQQTIECTSVSDHFSLIFHRQTLESTTWKK
jgi:hypothetical protein